MTGGSSCTTNDAYHTTTCSVAPSTSISIHSWDERIGAVNYHFDHWEGCGGLNGSANPALTFDASSDVTCTAVFVPLVTVTLNTKGGGGTVTGGSSCTTNDSYHTTTCSVSPSTSVSIHSWDEVVGSQTYRFDHWEACGSLNGSTNAALTFNATSDVTCTAAFVLN